MSKIIVRDDGCIRIQEVRLSYPHLFKPWAKNPEKEKAKYSAKFLLDKKTHASEIRTLGALVGKMMQEAFKGRIPNDKLFFRDGAGSAKPEQEDCWIISASEDQRPHVMNRDKSRVNEEDDIVYAGCYVSVLIRPWIQANSWGKRINANLLAVQFFRDGDRFGPERPDINDAFDDVSGEFEDEGVSASGSDDPFGEDDIPL